MLAGSLPWLDLAATPILAAMLWAIARIDAVEFRIPDALSLPLVVLGLGLGALRVGGLPMSEMIGAVLGYGVFAGLGAWLYRRRGEEALGLGDAKLLAAGGAWLGWAALPWLVLLAAGGALVWAALRGQRRLAFGPWLAAAFFALWVLFLTGRNFF